MKINTHLTKTEHVCKQQIDHLSSWVVNFKIKNIDTLRTNGIPAGTIYSEYCDSTRFPVGKKSFFPALHLVGLERIRKSNVVYYIVFTGVVD